MNIGLPLRVRAGVPKGVMLTHGNFLAVLAGGQSRIGATSGRSSGLLARLGLSGTFAPVSERDRCVAYLPLAHVLEIVTELFMILHGAPEDSMHSAECSCSLLSWLSFCIRYLHCPNPYLYLLPLYSDLSTHEGSYLAANSNGRKFLYNSKGLDVISSLVKYYVPLAHFNKVIKLLKFKSAVNLQCFCWKTQSRESILLRNLIWWRSLDCASHQKHCKFTADLNFKSFITLLKCANGT